MTGCCQWPAQYWLHLEGSSLHSWTGHKGKHAGTPDYTINTYSTEYYGIVSFKDMYLFRMCNLIVSREAWEQAGVTYTHTMVDVGVSRGGSWLHS